MLKYVYQQDFKTYKQTVNRSILTIKIKPKLNMIDDNMKIDIILSHIISPIIVK